MASSRDGPTPRQEEAETTQEEATTPPPPADPAVAMSDEAMILALLRDPSPVVPHVALHGLKRSQPRAMRHLFNPIHQPTPNDSDTATTTESNNNSDPKSGVDGRRRRANAATTTTTTTTMRQLYDACLDVQERLEQSGPIERATFFFEPMVAGEGHENASGDETQKRDEKKGASDKSSDVVVRWDVEERKGRMQLGVMTTMTGRPEVTASLNNIRGQGYAAEAHFQPNGSANGATGRFVVASHWPYVGRRTEVDLGVRREFRAMHLGDSIFDRTAKISFNVGGSQRKGTWYHTLRFGSAQRAVSATREGIAPEILSLVGLGGVKKQATTDAVGQSGNNRPWSDGTATMSVQDKFFVRWEAVNSRLRTHDVPWFRLAYPLPIGGHFSRAVVDLGVSEASISGRSNALKCEFLTSRFYSLLPFVTLNLSARIAAVAPIAADGVVHPADRLYLGPNYVRGWRDIGPSTVSASEMLGLDPPEQYLSLGGDLAWAASASLGMPLLPFPHNGLVGMHLFADVGQCTSSQWRSGLANAARRRQTVQSFVDAGVDGSAGVGLTLYQIPFLGPMPSIGRLEFNVAVPWTWRGGGVGCRIGEATPLFEGWRFGLHWTIADDL